MTFKVDDRVRSLGYIVTVPHGYGSDTLHAEVGCKGRVIAVSRDTTQVEFYLGGPVWVANSLLEPAEPFNDSLEDALALGLRFRLISRSSW